MLGVQVGRVRPKHLGLRPGEEARRFRSGGREWGRGFWGEKHPPQALQVRSGARRGLRGRRSGGSPKKGTKAAGRRHHLPDSALE